MTKRQELIKYYDEKYKKLLIKELDKYYAAEKKGKPFPADYADVVRAFLSAEREHYIKNTKKASYHEVDRLYRKVFGC